MLVLFGEIEHQGPLPRGEEQVNPDKILEDPACRWVLDRFACLMRKRRVMLLEGFADAILQSRIDEQTHRHDHQERHNPLGFFAIERRGQKAGVFEEAKAAFRMRLAFIACLTGPGPVTACRRGALVASRKPLCWSTSG